MHKTHGGCNQTYYQKQSDNVFITGIILGIFTKFIFLFLLDEPQLKNHVSGWKPFVLKLTVVFL